MGEFPEETVQQRTPLKEIIIMSLAERKQESSTTNIQQLWSDSENSAQWVGREAQSPRLLLPLRRQKWGETLQQQLM